MAKRIAAPEDVRALYEAGFTTDEVGEFLGVNGTSVWRSLKRQGIPLRKSGFKFGEGHHKWRGEEAGYSALHRRVESRRGRPQKCETCGHIDGQTRYEWACTGNYKKVEDYVRMCAPCHRSFDAEWRKSLGAAIVPTVFGERR